jgi:hypothetical protein
MDRCETIHLLNCMLEVQPLVQVNFDRHFPLSQKKKRFGSKPEKYQPNV